MSRKICFVAMGFGKKMDYRNSKEVDLDIIYKKVIKNLFDSLTEYELIRADEISGSEIIDVSMYSLLLKADLVIADITTQARPARTVYGLGLLNQTTARVRYLTILTSLKNYALIVTKALNLSHLLKSWYQEITL